MLARDRLLHCRRRFRIGAQRGGTHSDGHLVHWFVAHVFNLALLKALLSQFFGKLWSNVCGCRNGTAMGGVAGAGIAAPFSVSIIFGVTMTTSSMVERFRFLERNSWPRTGMSPMPGILLSWSVVR